MVGIINYGLGNLGSIYNMFKRIGIDSIIVRTPEELAACQKIILPGVGAFDTGMTHLKENNLLPVLNQMVLVEKKPILGICLGMQLMTQSSEEGKLPGLGWIKADTRKFVFGPEVPPLKVPHMGWNVVRQAKPSRLTAGFDAFEECRFYFVHSYYINCFDTTDILLHSDYGLGFTAAFEHENIYGVQFHPEKSHKFGLQLLKNFGEL